MIDIRMPRLSDTMEEGAIASWLKKPGDTVAVGDVLAEIETDKAVMEYEAYEAGTLVDILVPAGQSVGIGAVIARLDDGVSTEPTGPPAPAAGTAAPTPGKTDNPNQPAPAVTSRSGAPAVAQAVSDQSSEAPTARRLVASPLVRRLAREHHIDLRTVTGSGPGGRIVRADLDGIIAGGPAATVDGVPVAGTGRAMADSDTVDRGTAAAAAASVPTPSGNDGRRSTAVPFDAVRQVISQRLSRSSATVPHFYVTAVADVDDLLALRADLNATLAAGERPTVSVNDMIVRAAALALGEHPGVNASYSDAGDLGARTLVHERINVGIAVASSAGLFVPVIRDANHKTVSQIGTEAGRLAARAHDRRLGPAEMSDATFTVSNLGMYGVEQFTAIINPPEGAILAVGAALPEPVVVDGSVVVRRRMRYTLSADHRIIDGALAARFLATLTALLENPLRIVA